MPRERGEAWAAAARKGLEDEDVEAPQREGLCRGAAHHSARGGAQCARGSENAAAKTRAVERGRAPTAAARRGLEEEDVEVLLPRCEQSSES